MRLAVVVSLVAAACGVALGSDPCPAVKDCLGDLRSPAAGVRRQAAVRLGCLRERAAVPALMDALGDADASVRREAARALGVLRDDQAVEALVKALGDDETNVRFYAAYALGEIKSPRAAEALIAALGDPQWPVGNQAAWALREIAGPATARRLVGALKQPGADAAQIVWILRRSGGRAAVVGEVAAMLRAPEADTRRRAAEALGELGDPNAAGALTGTLGDASGAVRLAAVGALRALGDRRSAKPLAALAGQDADPVVREAARQAALSMSRSADLMAHWSFDGPAGQAGRDVTGRGNDGRILGCVSAPGKVGRALRFSKGCYVELGKAAGLPVGQSPMTVAAWVKPDAPNGVVVARGGAFCGFSLYVKDGVAKFGLHLDQDGPAYIAAGAQKVVGQWVHLAGVVRADRIELFVDGKLAATAKTPGYLPGNPGQGMEIGFDVDNSPAEITDNFEGVIDEVRMYGAALSAEEIAGECGLEAGR